ncbi:thermonuclease family protein [Rothia nasimurium]|uniref:thermonuclease family protein n=1 Tax=Rothia nasimurium TaxID=85336 RepID=UPI003BA30FAF
MRAPRRTLTATLMAGTLALSGCGLFGGKDAAETPTPAASTSSSENTDSARILRVVDSNTVEVDRSGKTVQVDLLGAITPQEFEGSEEQKCLHVEAKGHMTKLLPIGGPVTLTYDPALGPGEATDDKTPIQITASVTLADGALLAAEMVRAGYAVPSTATSGLDQEAISAAHQEADLKQAGLYSRTTDCTIPARLDRITKDLNTAQGLDLKGPIDAARELTDKLKGYEGNADEPLLATIASTQSVKNQVDTLNRLVDSKKIVFDLAEEADKERREREEREKQESEQNQPESEGQDGAAEEQPQEAVVEEAPAQPEPPATSEPQPEPTTPPAPTEEAPRESVNPSMDHPGASNPAEPAPGEGQSGSTEG